MNFSYLKKYPRFNKLRSFCEDAESFAISNPNISAISARKADEYIVKFIFTSQMREELYNYTLFEITSDPRFISYVNDSTVINTIHYIRKMGNAAAHDNRLNKDEALKVLEELHFLVGEFFILLGIIDDYPTFIKPETVIKTEKEREKAAQKEKIKPEEKLVAEFAPRMRAVRFNTKFKRDERENQKMFLEASLRESGWGIVNKSNQSMPGTVGINMILDDGTKVDYCMYGRDNKPVAIIENTVSQTNIVAGRMAGIKAADYMSKSLGYKPIVYYQSGYNIYIIDQLGYKPRRVFQYHTIEELELLKLRATIRKNITNPVIDDNITNRDYQKDSIRATCNAFDSKRRHSLLVMATGTGKTRVSISIVDILMKANWVKNVLFLADRTSLVKQAHKNYNKLLPQVTTAIYSGDNPDRDPNARIIFSTYQTMINLINDDTREFSIGRFDLIVIDEAHRSIFNKYSALFHYFDSLMLGLTATPRSEDNKSTYDMFHLENGNPDYAYELEEAVNDGYLVGFSILDKTTAAMKNNEIHYDDLSEEEKQRFEDTFADSSEYPDKVFSGLKINNQALKIGDKSVKIINLGTIDAMLNDLMKNGLKIEGGDKIGKTIIFAKNHMEAEQIVLRFHKLYAHLGTDFCKLIDSQTIGHQSLIEQFENRDSMPQVAVSVDMLDTGIDVPDILNLVFFKSVLSKIKFLQMIGRGTRLSPDIFGPGLDKKGFIVFDYFNNFNYFRTHNTWSTVYSGEDEFNFYNSTPQRILIYERKLGILRTLTEKTNLTQFESEYRDSLKDEFISKIRGLCNDDVEVQYHMPYVNKYRTKEYWETFTDSRINEIDKYILPLLPAYPDPVKVKNFDLLMYVIEDEVPKRMEADKDIRKIKHGFGNVGTKIDHMLEALTKIKTIPDILKREKLIQQMRNADLVFDNFSLELCEQVRKDLRDLMKYIPDEQQYYIINADDYIIEPDGDDGGLQPKKTYKERALEYIVNGDPCLAKIRNLDDLTKDEIEKLKTVFTQTLGTAADFADWSQNKELLPFLRIQVGIADEAIKTKFGTFLNESVMNEQQLEYMMQIIQYTRENGDFGFLDLQQVSPFNNVDVIELFGNKINYIKELINGLHKPVMMDD